MESLRAQNKTAAGMEIGNVGKAGGWVDGRDGWTEERAAVGHSRIYQDTIFVLFLFFSSFFLSPLHFDLCG